MVNVEAGRIKAKTAMSLKKFGNERTRSVQFYAKGAGMPALHLHIRRCRRTDFTSVMTLLAASGIPVPPPDRATLRRFRSLVADLGADFYLAEVDGTLAGLIHVTYARQLTLAPRAVFEQLLVAERFRGRGVGTALVDFARGRAQRRGCTTLRCAPPGPAQSAATGFLEKTGMHAGGKWFAQELSAPSASV